MNIEINKIKPHYVSFNTAKLLKEKGFNVPVRKYYHISTFIDSCNCV